MEDVDRRPTGRSGCARRSTRGGAGRGGRTATSTRSARCSTWPPGPRSSAATPACANFLESSARPADPRRHAGRAGGPRRRGAAAHRPPAKGLEWRLVVVAHVQEERLARPAPALDAAARRPDRQPTELLPPSSPRQLLAEERRLFYVACTRARERLVVTAVASPDDDGEQPSRFLAELGGADRSGPGRPARPLSLAGLVAELRRTVADPATPDAAPRRGRAPPGPARRRDPRRAARWCPQADPATWWGTRARRRVRRSRCATPTSRCRSRRVCSSAAELPGPVVPRARGGRVRGVHQSARASATSCTRSPTGWPRASPATDRRRADGPRRRGLGAAVFRTPWSRPASASESGPRSTGSSTGTPPDARTVLATEQRFSAEVELADGDGCGSTGPPTGSSSTPTAGRGGRPQDQQVRTRPARTVASHPQLGLYQLAVEHGAVDDLPRGARARSGGAELVQLGLPGESRDAKVQRQDPAAPTTAGARALRRAQLDRAAAYDPRRGLPRPSPASTAALRLPALCPIKGAGTVLS